MTEDEVEDFLYDNYGPARAEFGLEQVTDSDDSSTSSSDDDGDDFTRLVAQASIVAGLRTSLNSSNASPASEEKSSLLPSRPFKAAFSKIKNVVGGGSKEPRSSSSESSAYSDANSSGSSNYDSAASSPS